MKWLRTCLSILAKGTLIAVIFSRNIERKSHSREMYAQVDWHEVLLSFAGSAILVFALEGGSVEYGWSSGAIVSSFVISGIRRYPYLIIWDKVMLGFGYGMGLVSLIIVSCVEVALEDHAMPLPTPSD
jgi:hypothetical protein